MHERVRNPATLRAASYTWLCLYASVTAVVKLVHHPDNIWCTLVHWWSICKRLLTKSGLNMKNVKNLNRAFLVQLSQSVLLLSHIRSSIRNSTFLAHSRSSQLITQPSTCSQQLCQWLTFTTMDMWWTMRTALLVCSLWTLRYCLLLCSGTLMAGKYDWPFIIRVWTDQTRQCVTLFYPCPRRHTPSLFLHLPLCVTLKCCPSTPSCASEFYIDLAIYQSIGAEWW